MIRDRRRSLHFVPGGNEKMIAKALTLPADGLILDLEDAVSPDRKAATRPIVRTWLEKLDFGGRERWIRMNPLVTGFGRADLEETIAGRPDGYVVPKPRSAADIREVAQLLDGLEYRHGIPHGTTRLTIIATETPEGLLNIKDVATATPRTVAISWGVEDLGAAMGLGRVRDAAGKYLDIPRHARVMCAVAASAAGTEALDTVYTDIADLDGLRRECEDAIDMGFTGKISIHPSQIAVINAAFTPDVAVVDEARQLVAAFAEARARAFPSRPGGMAFSPTVLDPSQAPPGKHTSARGFSIDGVDGRRRNPRQAGGESSRGRIERYGATLPGLPRGVKPRPPSSRRRGDRPGRRRNRTASAADERERLLGEPPLRASLLLGPGQQPQRRLLVVG